MQRWLCDVDGLPHERLQVSVRDPDVRGNTPSSNPQLPSCVHLVPCSHFGYKLSLVSLPFVSVAVVSGGHPTRVVLHKLAKDEVEISYLISTGIRYLAGGRSGCRYLGECFVKARMDPRKFGLDLSDPRDQVIRRQSRTDSWRPGGGPRARDSCGGPGTQGSLRLSAGVGSRRVTRRITHRRGGNPQRSPQQ